MTFPSFLLTNVNPFASSRNGPQLSNKSPDRPASKRKDQKGIKTDLASSHLKLVIEQNKVVLLNYPNFLRKHGHYPNKYQFHEYLSLYLPTQFPIAEIIRIQFLHSNHHSTRVIITFKSVETTRKFYSFKPYLAAQGLYLVHCFKNIAPPLPLITRLPSKRAPTSSSNNNSHSENLRPEPEELLHSPTLLQQYSTKESNDESRESEDLQLIEVFPDLPVQEQSKIINRLDRLKLDLLQQQLLPPIALPRPVSAANANRTVPQLTEPSSTSPSWMDRQYLDPAEIGSPAKHMQPPSLCHQKGKIIISNVSVICPELDQICPVKGAEN
ncbi:uncharacterized protein LOC133383943 isoform X3 [Rhineura floridana]|uniref:uncharacterized protein LOC133383943 isoform X3 n=1 Tax=Rhineura floridana TaxID=261503 RepID=UPI002AC87438|nr:uncharacterized protein LOC133383943 isoform X3 [Rhineura floridana]